MKKLLKLLAIFVLMLTIVLVSCNAGGNSGKNQSTTEDACKHDDPEMIEVFEGVAATCQETGLTMGVKCLKCGTMVIPQTVSDKIECIESRWIVDVEATETHEGSEHTVCIMCEKIMNVRVIPVKGFHITLWVSTTRGVKEITEQQIQNFKMLHPEYQFTFTVETVAEGDAAGEVLKDVTTAPDLYCFDQSHTSRLVQNGALAPLGVSASAIVRVENDAGSVNAATVGDMLYAYPMTSDNGYYLFYDASVISDEEAKTLEGIVAACERAGKTFSYAATNGWYAAGFFFSQPVGGGDPLCTSKWIFSGNSYNPVGVYDTFNSANGLIAMKGMRILTANRYVHLDTERFNGTAAAINGYWNFNAIQAEYGDNIRATKLPTFTVDGVEYQMGSFAGYRLLGCKPQQNPEKAKICSDLALYLTSAESQLERYYEFYWGPSNLEAQANPDVKLDMNISALAAQSVYAQPQGLIHGDWWSEMSKLGGIAMESHLTDADILAALEEYERTINGFIK